MARRTPWRERGLRGLALLALAGTGVGVSSCGMNGDECLHLPCPMPRAIELRVTAAGGGAAPGVVVTASGATSMSGPCRAEATAAICSVPGYAGVYDLEVKAPGFETQKRSVTVAGTRPECGCPTTATVELDLALTPVGAH